MKRIQSACLEQTSRFESEADFSDYIAKLQVKGTKYKLLSSETAADASVTTKMKLQYQNYETGEYFS